MIIGILYMLVGSVLYLLSVILGWITFTLPDQLLDSIAWLFSKTAIFNGVFPLDTLYQALGIIILAWLAKWLLKIAIWVLSMIPGVKIGHPHEKVTNNTKQHAKT